jgi:hypothetical protein
VKGRRLPAVQHTDEQPSRIPIRVVLELRNPAITRLVCHPLATQGPDHMADRTGRGIRLELHMTGSTVRGI